LMSMMHLGGEFRVIDGEHTQQQGDHHP